MLDRSAQKESAMRSMTEWLTDKKQLGKPPFKIESIGGFRLHGMHYYMFRFKKSLLSKWLVGVCGGYLADKTENCGHVISEMNLYHPETAQADCTAMAEKVREYYAGRAKELLEKEEGTNDPTQKEETGPFTSSILLSTPFFDPMLVQTFLASDWDMHLADRDVTSANGSLFCDIDGMIATVSLVPNPVADGEAEMNAVNNSQWPEAVEVTQGHTAHLLIVIISRGRPALDAGRLLVKIVAACLKQKNAVGVFTCGTVMRPAFYLDAAQVLKKGGLPLLNWIYFGLNPSEHGLNGYTYGMAVYGHLEIEVLDSDRTPDALREFLVSTAYFILENDAVTKDVQSIPLGNGQNYAITCSLGVSVDGLSMKISCK